MATLFFLNGSEERGYSKGAYNDAMGDVAERFCQDRSDTFIMTRIRDGYDIEEEISKFEQADTIIYQFPIYWFHMPGLMKTYIDDVFMAGRGRIWLNDGRAQGGDYGSGGLMQQKHYMISTTWNAPTEAFNDSTKLFDGKSVDEALFMFHKMKQFMGAKPLESFSCHNIIQNPNLETDQNRFRAHLEKILFKK